MLVLTSTWLSRGAVARGRPPTLVHDPDKAQTAACAPSIIVWHHVEPGGVPMRAAFDDLENAAFLADAVGPTLGTVERNGARK